MWEHWRIRGERMRFFHGADRKGPYFEGWYLKHQNRQGQMLAVIPAFHIRRDGRRSASLQVITKERAWWLEYPEHQFHAEPGRFQVQVGRSRFHRRGLTLDVEGEGLSLTGSLEYGPFAPLRSDIMGPFRLFGGMQCAHGVLSMGHTLSGTLCLNGTPLTFSGGIGYIETDRGRSFPQTYLWTQCVWEQGSVMLAVATVPLPVGRFTGCICAVLYQGREYRLATYRGARIEAWSPSGAVIRQGDLRLQVELLSERAQALRAPVEGSMERTIHESLCGEVRCRFWRDGELLVQHTSQCASFEYAQSPGPAG